MVVFLFELARLLLEAHDLQHIAGAKAAAQQFIDEVQTIGVPIADAGQTGEGEMDLREAFVARAPDVGRAPNFFTTSPETDWP